MKEGATARRAAVREMVEWSSPNAMAARFTFTEQNYPAMRTAILEMVEGLNGRLEAFYYALGEIDAIAIIDVPDEVSLAAAILRVNAAGMGRATATVLLTAEDIDKAIKKPVGYRPPGG